MRFPPVSAVRVLMALAALTPTTFAQRYLVAEQDTLTVRIADLGAGALLGSTFIDVGATANPTPLRIWDAVVVDDEIWVSADSYVHRYDRTTLNWIAAIGPLTPPLRATGIDVAGGYAWIASWQSLLKVDFDGGIVANIPVVSAHDVLARAGELLVSNRIDARIDRYDFSGTHLGVFADISNLGFSPEQLARRANGNVLVTALVRILELDSAGNLVDVIQAGFFEQGVAESSGGQLFVPTFEGPAQLHDNVGNRIFSVGGSGMRFVSPLDRRPTSRRYCPASPNSTGLPASVAAMGSASVDSNDFRLLLTAAPADALSLLIWGDASADQPFGNGTLCVHPASAGFVRSSVIRTDEDGIALDRIDLDTPPGIRITPGTTWYFQFVFRDVGGGSAGFNLSDAAQVTFRP